MNSMEVLWPFSLNTTALHISVVLLHQHLSYGFGQENRLFMMFMMGCTVLDVGLLVLANV